MAIHKEEHYDAICSNCDNNCDHLKFSSPSELNGYIQQHLTDNPDHTIHVYTGVTYINN